MEYKKYLENKNVNKIVRNYLDIVCFSYKIIKEGE